MMWGANTIANLKENLNKIVLDVHDASDDDEDGDLGVGPSRTPNGHDSAAPHRRNSWTSSRSTSRPKSPLANGINSTLNPEIEQYEAEIKRLQSSEAEVKALSVNYAALLKEKEDQILRLNKENGSLKQSMKATNEALSAAKGESVKLHTNGASTKKGLADLLDRKNHSAEAFQTEIKQMKAELQQKRDQLEKMQQKFQEEHQLTESFKDELNLLKSERVKATKQMSQIQNELSEKISEIEQLKMELNRQEASKAESSVDSLRNVIANLQKENTILKREKNDLESALEISRSFSRQSQSQEITSLNETVDSSRSFPGKQEMDQSIAKLEKERDKAMQQLARLKQHLLEKESEESEKMDEDTKIIEELRERNEYLRAQVSHLEKTVKQAIEGQQELKISYNNEVQKSKEIIDDLNIKLANCMRKIEEKDIELLNLQTALGQYYAEIEAKEHLERELTHSREEAARCSQLLKDADDRVEVSKREKEDILAKLLQTEKTLAEWKGRVNKLEEDNAKVRRALEQSMTRLNRMSVESDYLVDRRIVIKLLVTYFQRNHSKEVLDLMVRMLGFSDEDKQRIGIAQQGTGRGVVRGVLGFPGRLVGGILGGSSAEAGASMGSENQSFADLWVDFLLKEEEERERREAAAANLQGRSPAAVEHRHQPTTSHGNSQYPGRFSSEFSTVPLTSSSDHTSLPRMLSR